MSGLNKFLMHEVEMPLIPVVADMEDAGYQVNREHFDTLRARLEPEMGQVLGRIRTFAGETFNPDSPDQLRELLYNRLKARIIKRTPSGKPSTNKTVMKHIAIKHGVARDIVRYRELKKILTTCATIPEKIDADGRLRVSFNQLAAETGRFSSASIIQTLPKNDEFQIRQGFLSGNGNSIVGADFDQQELRVLAQLSRDKAMKSAIKAGVDLHGLAAVKVFKLDCDLNEVKQKHKDKRDRVKAIQFGLIYQGLRTRIGKLHGLRKRIETPWPVERFST